MNGIANTRETIEQAVLGACILTPAAIDILITEHVRPGHFRRVDHKAICHAMLAMHDQGHQVDALTLKARFDSPQSPVRPADIDMLAASVDDLGNLRSYVRILRENAWFDHAATALFNAGDALKARDRDAMLAAFARLDQADEPAELVDNATEFRRWYDSDQHGWTLPFDQLTEAIGGGLNPGETSIIGSWSGFGKTYLLSQFLRHIASEGARVREFASEMHGPKRTARQIAAITGIPKHRIERKELTPEETRRVLGVLKTLPYETEPSNGWQPEDYCRALRRHKPDVAAIDTASNLPCSRIDEWDRAATMLADTAAQTGTHLFQVFQLNLERDKGKRPPPVARDLRFGGTFYARARNVLFLHRDQEAKQAGDGQELWLPTSEGHIRVDKATHGDNDPRKSFLLVSFNPYRLRFDQQGYARHLEAV